MRILTIILLLALSIGLKAQSTVIYDTYYTNIASGKIDLKNVNFSAYVVDSTYVAKPTDKKANVTGKIETLVKILVAGDISTLSMSQIIDKVTASLDEEEKKKARGFVIYDIGTGVLCFYEPLTMIR